MASNAPRTALAACPGGSNAAPSRRPVNATAPDAAQSAAAPTFSAPDSTSAPSHRNILAACHTAAPVPGTATANPSSGRA
jgi:hypothetical protein